MLVSVIIPALNEAQNIQACIAAAQRRYAPDQVEIIVVDGGSHDGTPELVSEGTSVGDLVQQVKLLYAPRGRAVQMNTGAANAQGDIFVFCHADSQLPQGWREAVIAALSAPGVSGGTFQTLILPANWMLKIRNRWVFPANWKIMFGDQVQFMQRTTFEAVGGFPEIPLMEDVEMSRALHNAGQLVRIPPQYRVITSSRRFAERGFLRQSLLNGMSMVRYLYLGATPEDIARVYRSSREEATSGTRAMSK
jgi:rSAM/selenodomain-associated transferase 2